jgi:hypothetical protein
MIKLKHDFSRTYYKLNCQCDNNQSKKEKIKIRQLIGLLIIFEIAIFFSLKTKDFFIHTFV